LYPESGGDAFTSHLLFTTDLIADRLQQQIFSPDMTV
jgi:hypothetical protein